MMRRFRSYPTIGGRRGGIPADCVEVQYLESPMVSNQSLGAYIDTGIIPQYGDAVTLDVDIPNLENYWLTALAIYNPTFRVTARLTSSAKYWFTEGFTRPTEPTGRNEWHGTYTYSASYSPLSISLNAQHESGRFVNRGVGIKYYSFSVTRNGSLLIDLVPVRRVENGVSVGYMCDRLTGALYGNAGTGAFVIGPDAGEPVWTFTDGYSLTSTGGLSANQYYSVLDQYVNAESGHSITIYWGEQRAYGNTNCLLEYDSAKNIVDYWSYNQSSGMRTITLSSRTGFVRASFKTSEIANCYIKDNTTGEYLFKGSNVN